MSDTYWGFGFLLSLIRSPLCTSLLLCVRSWDHNNVNQISHVHVLEKRLKEYALEDERKKVTPASKDDEKHVDAQGADEKVKEEEVKKVAANEGASSSSKKKKTPNGASASSKKKKASRKAE
jgi:hypothetical protein